jgi:hypothetical protein
MITENCRAGAPPADVLRWQAERLPYNQNFFLASAAAGFARGITTRAVSPQSHRSSGQSFRGYEASALALEPFLLRSAAGLAKR